MEPDALRVRRQLVERHVVEAPPADGLLDGARTPARRGIGAGGHAAAPRAGRAPVGGAGRCSTEPRDGAKRDAALNELSTCWHGRVTPQDVDARVAGPGAPSRGAPEGA